MTLVLCSFWYCFFTNDSSRVITRVLDSLIKQKYGTDEMHCGKTRIYSHENRLYVPGCGGRGPGGVDRAMFLGCTQCLLGDLNDMLDQRQLSAMAQDRCSWRKLVVAAPQPNDDDDDEAQRFLGY